MLYKDKTRINFLPIPILGNVCYLFLIDGWLGLHLLLPQHYRHALAIFGNTVFLIFIFFKVCQQVANFNILIGLNEFFEILKTRQSLIVSNMCEKYLLLLRLINCSSSNVLNHHHYHFTNCYSIFLPLMGKK